MAIDWGKIGDKVFGTQGEIDWDELTRLMEYEQQLNRTDRAGIFSGWEWARDADGNPTNMQRQTIAPAFQGAVDRLGYNAGKGANPYTLPGGMNQMLDAKVSRQAGRDGFNQQPFQEYQQDYNASPDQFQPSIERPGMYPDEYLPPPPNAEGEVPPLFPAPGEDPDSDYGAAPPPMPEAPVEPSPGAGLPPDYYNDKGNVRRKYRPGNKWYVGDEELRRWAEDPDYQGANLPTDYYNDKGKPRRRYRDQEYYELEPGEGGDAIYGTGTGAPDDWLNDKGNIRRRYQGLSPETIAGQPDDYYNDKGNVRRKYRTGG